MNNYQVASRFNDDEYHRVNDLWNTKYGYDVNSTGLSTSIYWCGSRAAHQREYIGIDIYSNKNEDTISGDVLE